MNSTFKCPVQGNPDLYGLGIRIALYTQILTALVSGFASDVLEVDDDIGHAVVIFILATGAVLFRMILWREIEAIESVSNSDSSHGRANGLSCPLPEKTRDDRRIDRGIDLSACIFDLVLVSWYGYVAQILYRRLSCLSRESQYMALVPQVRQGWHGLLPHPGWFWGSFLYIQYVNRDFIEGNR
jgi:hypothetical protein